MGLLRRATGSFVHQASSRAMGRWKEAHDEALLRKQRMAVMESALRRLRQKELARGSLAWREYTAVSAHACPRRPALQGFLMNIAARK